MPENATLLPELQLARRTGARYIAGVDEVGRGALAGPVSIGAVVVDLASEELAEVSRETGIWPKLDGVRDSKLLTPTARQRWAPVCRQSAAACAVIHRRPAEIDTLGITGAMRAAGIAALNDLEAQLGAAVDAVILDGSHDWLTRGTSSKVHTRVRADVDCLTVASASVVAKVDRDALMGRLALQSPHYGWDTNRGYGSTAHRSAIRLHGPTVHHRLSWNLGV